VYGNQQVGSTRYAKTYKSETLKKSWSRKYKGKWECTKGQLKNRMRLMKQLSKLNRTLRMQIIPATTASTTSLRSSKDILTALVANIPAKATELSLRQFVHGTLMQRGFCGVDHVPL
jgi:hypothetical protein